MTLKQLVSTVLVFLLVFSARGQEAYMPEDFAYGAPLSESENAIRKFYLTAEILKDLANRDAGDLRVYDSQDNVMPAIVRLAGAAAVAEKRSLEFFPLYEMTNTGSAMETLQIMRDSGNQIQRIVSTQNSPEPGKRIAAYLIDQGVDVPSDRAMRLTRLHLDWEGSLHANLIQLKLEHSDNLNTWQLLPGQFTLSDLVFQNRTLKENTLAFTTGVQRFIRITFADSDRQVELSSVEAVLEKKDARPVEWLTLGPLAKDTEKNDSYRFSLPGGVLPTWLRFAFASDNHLLSGNLYMLNQKDKWVLKAGDFSQFRVTTGGVEGSVLQSSPLRLGGTLNSEWRFTPDGAITLNGEALPAVEIGFLPREVVFLAQGVSPYRVVWGNIGVGKQDINMRVLLSGANMNDQNFSEVLIGDKNSIRGQAAINSDDGDWWQQWVLWLVLVLAVLIVMRMAWQLFREMNGQ